MKVKRTSFAGELDMPYFFLHDKLLTISLELLKSEGTLYFVNFHKRVLLTAWLCQKNLGSNLKS